MLDELGCPPVRLYLKGDILIIFYKSINGLTEVPFEGVLIEVYKDTTTIKKMTDSFSLKTITFTKAPSLAEFKSKCKNVHPIRDVPRRVHA